MFAQAYNMSADRFWREWLGIPEWKGTFFDEPQPDSFTQRTPVTPGLLLWLPDENGRWVPPRFTLKDRQLHEDHQEKYQRLLRSAGIEP